MAAEATGEQFDEEQGEFQEGDPSGGVPVLDLSSKEAEGQEYSKDGHSFVEDDEKKGDQERSVEAVTETPELIAKEDFSVFTVGQKRAIIIAGSFAAWFSPMSGSIYYPALTQIADDLHVSDAKINITVTTYLIIQGVAPMMIAGFSDKAGRRPAYFLCFFIYICANLGLALQDDYAALLVLRMLQSAGSSGTVALANGIVGDLVVSAERGNYIAFASLGSILGPTLSPLIGGLISQFVNWHWIFWFLLILSVVFFIPFALFLPETCRKIVGDGSVPPPWSSVNISDNIRFKNRAKKGIPTDEEKVVELRKNYKLSVPNPVGTLVVLYDPESALLLVATGLALACFYAISTGASVAFKTVYGFDDLQVSLMFLPIGGGSIISAFTTGRLVDWNYRRHAKRLNFPVDRKRQMDLSNFPIELARMQIGLPLMLVGAAAVIGYGWMMTHKVSLAGPIIILFIMGYSVVAGFQCLNVLMVDIYPGKPATATAANNLVRCLLGAAASAAIVPMSNVMGNGWAYTTLALIFMVSSLCLAATMKYGIQLRKAKKAKQERKQAAKDAKNEAKREKVERLKMSDEARRCEEADLARTPSR